MNYAIIDTESTGLVRDPWARVVEIGAVAFTDGALEIGTFSSFMCPYPLDERSERALAFNGIPFETVASAPTEDAVREHFSRWIDNYSVSRFYSYNQLFDQTMLERSGFYLPWAGCVMQLAKKKMNANVNPSLRKAADFFGVPYSENAHRALSDARCAADVLHRIVHTPLGSI